MRCVEWSKVEVDVVVECKKIKNVYKCLDSYVLELKQ